MLAVMAVEISFRPLRWLLIGVLVALNLLLMAYWYDLDAASRPGMDEAVQYCRTVQRRLISCFGSSF